MNSENKISLKDSIATRMLLVILGIYLLVAMSVTLSHVVMEYQYQKKNILQDLGDIEQAFENGLAVNMWGIDEQALKASVEGMLKIPTLVGVKIINSEKATVAIGGIITEQNKTGKADLHINLSGFNDEKEAIPESKLYNLEMFEHQFSITHNIKGEDIILGQATIYSNSSIIYRRMKLQVAMLLINVVLALFTFSIALLWVINRYLRKPLEILTNATENILLTDLGSFAIDTKTSRRNEIKVLEESINSMVADLHSALLKQHKTEVSLLASEQKYRTLFEKSNDAIFIVDKDTGRYIDANYAATLLTGRTLEELKNLTTRDITPKGAHNRLKRIKEFDNFDELGTVIYQRPDNSKRYAKLSKVPLDDLSVIGIAKDITDDLKLEQQLRQTQKMESIGTLAGGIAHDFNNILFPILGNTEMLLEDVSEDSPFRSKLNGIYTSSLRAKELVKQILTFSRQDTNELKLMKMQPIIKEVLKLIRSTIPTTIEIKQNVQSDCGLIKADPTQIHQILMNLTTNAFHAMEEKGGKLTVNLKKLTLEKFDLINPEMTPGEYSCLTISDTGVGMDKDLTDKIFDPFFTTKEMGKGTGMGLSVVHGIVTNMNGAIQVYSEPGKGTDFNIYFPVEQNRLIKQITNSKIEIRGGTEQILLVDDEQTILTMEQKMMENLGYKVTACNNSIEALKIFKDNPDQFNLVITDMQMPHMTGVKLTKKLTVIRPDIPIMLCTGFSETMSEEKAASLGIKEFLLKPIIMKDLAKKIREVLDKE